MTALLIKDSRLMTSVSINLFSKACILRYPCLESCILNNSELFYMNSDEEQLYIKNLALDTICNFVVKKFFFKI
jgi:hypothetical protein